MRLQPRNNKISIYNQSTKSATKIGPTSTAMNAFAQVWVNTPGPNSTSWGSSPSILVALPYLMPQKPKPTFLNPITFTFFSSSGTILNSDVTGPQSQRYFSITTDSTKGGFFIIQNFGGESIAMIEWRKHPVVEIFGTVSMRTSAEWLRLSPSKEYRLMASQGRYYRWTAHDRYIRVRGILTSQSNPQLFGRILQTQEGTAIELGIEALQLGLLKVLVVSTLLLLCGRNID
ncbi:hypothetical protein K438DRAFT_1592019 [Mycena galopus ATCC 62051]|nr:hypothetical protein K438DRAFT_1592019 [Mycena galopus ATCC 62051]